MRFISKAMTIAVFSLGAISIWANGILYPYLTDYAVRLQDIRPFNVAPRSYNYTDVQVQVQELDVYGSAWDGLASLGGMVGPIFAPLGLSSPPDVTICVVSIQQTYPYCGGSVSVTGFIPECMNALSCDMEIPLPDTPFALVIFDVDNGYFSGTWDYIDAAIIVYEENKIEIQNLDKLKEKTSFFIEKVSPTTFQKNEFFNISRFVFNQEENLRRKNSLPTFRFKGVDTLFTLSQSHFTIYGE